MAWANFAGGLNGILNRGNNAADGVPVSLSELIFLDNFPEHVRELAVRLRALWNRK
jgi:hypothetical protein